MRISADPFPSLFSPSLSLTCADVFDMQVTTIARSNEMDGRIVIRWSPCTTTRRTVPGYVSFAVVPPPPPSFHHPTPGASKRAYARTLTLTPTRTDQRGTRCQRTIYHPARWKRDRVRLADAAAKSTRGLPLHIQAPRPSGNHAYPRALRHVARGRPRARSQR
jgi:hypothetical protein